MITLTFDFSSVGLGEGGQGYGYHVKYSGSLLNFLNYIYVKGAYKTYIKHLIRRWLNLTFTGLLLPFKCNSDLFMFVLY